MDECTDMTISDASSKNLHFNSSPTHAIDLNYQKNPFDRQFELARKHNINPLRYAPSISNINQTSPLNTPSISLNDGATPWITLPTAMVTGSLTEPETATSALPPKVPSTDETTTTITAAPHPLSNITATAKVNNIGSTNQRSNVVSVICPPSAKPSEQASEGGGPVVKSAPVIIESNRESANNTNSSATEDDVPLNLKAAPKTAPELSCYSSGNRPSKQPVVPITLLVSLANQRPHISLPIQVNSHSASQNWDRPRETLSSLIKIVPKHDNSSNNKCAVVNMLASSINNIPKPPLSLSSLPSRKKEKSEEELLNKLKATEAALPPKAKPGRKSRSATEEDTKDKKKRSLERNRAAAMRCRLKKKKEVDELKCKVEEYEQQNNELRRIIDDLYREVRELKGELLRHKDCC